MFYFCVSISLFFLGTSPFFCYSSTTITSHDIFEEKIRKFNYKTQNEIFWKKYLKGERLQVCRYHAHEPTGAQEYDKFYLDGTYYCACCGGDYPLFSSETKFDAETGWPTFYAPLENAVLERPDPVSRLRLLLGLEKTEVICARCGSHLGHVFNDGPPPTGKRYAISSITLIFIPEGEQPKRSFDIQNEDLLTLPTTCP